MYKTATGGGFIHIQNGSCNAKGKCRVGNYLFLAVLTTLL